MEGVPQQDVRELDTLKEQDILAIIGMFCETAFILSIEGCVQMVLLNRCSSENRSNLEKNRKSCKPKYAVISVVMVNILK